MSISRRVVLTVLASSGALLIACDRAESQTALPVSTTPILEILSVSPEVGPPGTPISLRGSGFTPGMTVAFDGVAATNVTVISSTHLTAVAPPHGVGLADIVLASPDGQTTTLRGRYRYGDVADGCAGCWDYNRAPTNTRVISP
jgi:hypothetical protein